MRIFDCKIEACRETAQGFPKITKYLCKECEEHFQKFCAYLEFYKIPYTVEPHLVRGIDYYTKTTFEFVSRKLGAQDAILGGGRYDDMMKEFGGPDICGIGFAIGMGRLISVVPSKKTEEGFLYLAYLGEEAKKAGMELVQFLRSKGVECLMEFRERSLRNQMSRANKLGATWVLIVGEDEVRKGK